MKLIPTLKRLNGPGGATFFAGQEYEASQIPKHLLGYFVGDNMTTEQKAEVVTKFAPASYSWTKEQLEQLDKSELKMIAVAKGITVKARDNNDTIIVDIIQKQREEEEAAAKAAENLMNADDDGEDGGEE
ncbi:MAG: hypothetical protein ACQ5SW_08190 [Sphaerochaetaceae bacterium]